MNGIQREITANWAEVVKLTEAAPDLVLACTDMLIAWDHSSSRSVAMRAEAIARMRKLMVNLGYYRR